ncbi:MAG: hypothetical protein ABJF11_12340 [Reichenbachiella sp.]|uniref:hypothetical protein n=1 Tax=Reichenbachiella sp. TaxID=2184521 RepID=UPI003262EDA2
MKKVILVLFILLSSQLQAQEAGQLYKVTLLRAKPGSLLELITQIKSDLDKYKKEQSYLLRHSQGDHWDLMVIYTIESMEVYFSSSQSEQRQQSVTLEQPYGDDFFDLVSFQEEAIVEGPDKDTFDAAMQGYDLFHIEIFTALAGKQKELLQQRKAENDFYAGIDHRPNFIFTRVFGPSWDIFTIGWYKDLHDFAGPAVPFEEEDKAAKAAGFEGVNFIGSYLRSLLLEHHDTFAGKVK